MFVAKLNADGDELLYATYLGGSGDDYATALAIDATGAAVVVGETSSSDFPVTPGAFDGTYEGGLNGGDAFVAKLSAGGDELLYATYLGGGEGDGATALAIDVTGAVVVVGSTSSSDFPVTPGAFSDSYGGGDGDYGDGFVARLSANGTELLYATYLGGSGNDYATALVIDATDAVVVAGGTSSADFPATPGRLRRHLQRQLQMEE